MKKTAIALGIALTAISGAANAAFINGVNISPGSFLEIGTVWEGRVDASDGTGTITLPGQELGGVGVIDTIKDQNGNVTWVDGQNGTHLSFWFDSYLSQTITAGPPIGVNFSGGVANFYTTASLFTPTGSFAADKATISAGTPWLNTVGGGNQICTVAMGCFSGAGTVITLAAAIFSGDLIAIGSAAGNGFLEVTGGPAGPFMDTNAINPGAHDLALGSSFDDLNTSGYGASGSVNIKGLLVVPEPGSLALLGLGLVGFAATRRKTASV